jgi:hypothetical protein
MGGLQKSKEPDLDMREMFFSMMKPWQTPLNKAPSKGQNKEQREIDPRLSLKIGTQIALWV